MESGDALEAARSDHQEIQTEREIERTLKDAWQELVEEPDEIVVERLSDKVESLCGYQPDIDQVEEFLTSQTDQQRKPKSGSQSNRQSTHDKTSTSSTSRDEEQLGFTYKEEFHPTSSAKETLIEVLEVLSSQDTTFSERMAAREHGRKRNYIAAKPEDLYPGRPDLAEKHSEKLSNGWWVGTNYSSRRIEGIIELAAEVAGLDYGTELQAHLDSD